MEPEDLESLIDLIRRARAGEREALDALLARYYESVRRIVRLRLGVALSDRQDVNDMLQDILISSVNAFEHLPLRNEASFVNWIARIAEIRVLTGLRHQQSTQPGGKGSKPAEFRIKCGPVGVNLVATGLLPDEDAANTARDATGAPVADPDRVAQVETAITKLPPEMRELIILRNYAGFTWESIAKHTGSPSAAAARMLHAKAIVNLGRLVRTALRRMPPPSQ